jgi:hypothetical protein
MALAFEWDANKARTNLVKHGISFRRSGHRFRGSTLVDHFGSGSFGCGKPFCHHRRFPSREVAGCRPYRTRRTISASSPRESRADESERIMKKVREKNNEMLREYDFSQGVRGKYARRYARGSNVVVLEPDVANVFPNAEAVNSSLRGLAEIIRHRKSVASK